MPEGPDYEAAFHKLPVCVVFTDKSGTIRSANEAFRRILPESEDLSKDLSGFSDITYAEVYQGPTSSGFLVSVRKVKYSEDTDIYLLEDITADYTNKKQRFLLADIFEKSSLPALVTDEYEHIIRVNYALCQATGYKVSELIGNRPTLFKSKVHDSYFYYNLWQQLVRDGSWQGEIHNRRKDGTIIPQLATIHALRDEEGAIRHFFAIYTDITEQKKQQERYRFLASHDPLTELPNRALFQDRLVFAIDSSERNQGNVGIILLDLDRFKIINESLKHFGGDLLLMAIADRIRKAAGPDQTLARISGDEFAILVTGNDVSQAATQICQNIAKELKEPFNVKGQEVYITVSSGISIYPYDGEDFTSLLQNAETAMYQSKRSGKNAYNFYNSKMNNTTVETMIIESSLRKSLEENHFYIAYQPQYNHVTGTFTGMEALLRWEHPELGSIEPGRFIPIAEESGFIVDLGQWVVKTIVQDIENGDIPEDINISFNVSPRQFVDPEFVSIISSIIYSKKLAGQLELEITESLAMEDAVQKRFILEKLSELGLKIMIDDFGVGYSSMVYLKQFPIHGLKIDRSFVQDLTKSRDSKAIVQAVISLAKSFEITLVAEGVESREQADILANMGCNIFQGFYYSMPEPIQTIKEKGILYGNRYRTEST